MNNFWKSRSKRHSRQKQTLEAKDLRLDGVLYRMGDHKRDPQISWWRYMGEHWEWRLEPDFTKLECLAG